MTHKISDTLMPQEGLALWRRPELSHDDILCLGEGKDGFLTLGFQPHYVSFCAHFLSVRVFCGLVGLFFREGVSYLPPQSPRGILGNTN